MAYAQLKSQLRQLVRELNSVVRDADELLKMLEREELTEQKGFALKRKLTERAARTLESQGYSVSYGPGGKPIVTGGTLGRTGSGDGGYRTPPPPATPLGPDGFPDVPQPPRSQPSGGRFTPQPVPITEILTPQSSNVYSFAYYRRQGDKLGTLYVRYKAHEVNLKAVSQGGGKYGGKQQLHGTLGRTVGQHTDAPGPLYAYYAVPAEIYNRMKSAASKGSFVWDALRERGSVYGHQFQYGLVSGFEVPDSGGLEYIPRKATAKGFKVRSVADIGSGRRRFSSSTLPDQEGHYRSPSMRGR